MKKLHFVFSLLLILLILSKNSSAQSYYAMTFTENKGQWPDWFLYKGKADAGTLFIEKDGFRILKQHPEDLKNAHSKMHGMTPETRVEPVKTISPMEDGGKDNHLTEKDNVRTHVYKVSFTGSSSSVVYSPEKPTGETSNYFLGNDPSKWKTDVSDFASVIGRGLYPGIDIRYYSNSSNLKYDLIVSPGADPSRIQLNYDGVDDIKVENGVLVIKTSVGESKELKPYAYQIINGLKKEVFCSYVVKGNKVSYKLKDYDPASKLVIDPDLIFSTFSGSKADNWGATAAPGPDGSLYGGGIVFNEGYPNTNQTAIIDPSGSPISTGPGYTPSFQGIDIALTRFSPNGQQRIFSVYFGGDGNDMPLSIFVDPDGNPVIAGRSNSTNIPTTVGSKFSSKSNDFDILVFKLSSDGKRIIGSRLIGGSGRDGANSYDDYYVPNGSGLYYNYGDMNRSEVILDNQLNVYIASSTSSNDFPLATKNSKKAKQDGIVIKLNPDLSQVLYATYVGGDEDDAAFVLAKHPTKDLVYVAGATKSSTIDGVGAGVYKSSNQGGVDGFVTVLNGSGQILNSSFWGTSSTDIIYGIQFGKTLRWKTDYSPHITGISLGDWPVVGNPSYVVPGSKQFISKLQEDLSGFIYSTTFGTKGVKPNISPVAFLVDRCENVYVSGWGGDLSPCSNTGPGSQTLGTFGLPVKKSKPGDYLQSYTDGSDFYFFVLEQNAKSLLYATFFGQTGGYGDHVDGGTSRFDEKGSIYQAMCAGCFSTQSYSTRELQSCPSLKVTRKMITTPGVVAPYPGSMNCNLGVVKYDLDMSGVNSGLLISKPSDPDKEVVRGCAPFNVLLKDVQNKGKTYVWSFGDGTPDTTTTVNFINHEFKTDRDTTFEVRLVSINYDYCIPTDTSYKKVFIGVNNAPLRMEASSLGCGTNIFTLKNLTPVNPAVPFSDKAFLWKYSDGHPSDTLGFKDVPARLFTSNTIVTLTLLDTNFCNALQSIQIKVSVDPTFRAKFKVLDDSICVGDKVQISDSSLGALEYFWDFENDKIEISGFPVPDYSYKTEGMKVITLRITDKGCRSDLFYRDTVYVFKKPVASFNYTPIVVTNNVPFTFYSTASTNSTSFQWLFGDGTQSAKKDTVYHLYTSTSQYNVKLIAYNDAGCSDDTAQLVTALITADTTIRVPSAFTPNGDGKNDVLNFYAYGVTKLNFQIFNRWGNLVFQTNDPLVGWDGTYNGVPQPMDTYTYVCSFSYSNESRIDLLKSKPGPVFGTVTLIR